MWPEASNRRAPPLPAMLCGAMLAAAAALALMVSPYAPTQQLDRIFLDATRQALTQPAHGDVRVIALGSSLLLMATPPRADGKLKWARITKSGWGLGPLDSSLTLLEYTPPDILVIESNLIVQESSMTIEMLRRNVMMAARAFIAPAGAPLDPYLLEKAAEQVQHRPCLSLKDPTDAELARYQEKISLAYRRGPDEKVAARLMRIVERGMRVMIVDIPRSGGVEVATAADKQRWFARVRMLLPPGAALSYHVAPSYSQRSLYCDGIHLNPAGAKVFEEWWWKELQQVQRKVR